MSVQFRSNGSKHRKRCRSIGCRRNADHKGLQSWPTHGYTRPGCSIAVRPRWVSSCVYPSHRHRTNFLAAQILRGQTQLTTYALTQTPLRGGSITQQTINTAALLLLAIHAVPNVPTTVMHTDAHESTSTVNQCSFGTMNLGITRPKADLWKTKRRCQMRYIAMASCTAEEAMSFPMKPNSHFAMDVSKSLRAVASLLSELLPRKSL